MSIPHKSNKYILDQVKAKAEAKTIRVNHSANASQTYTYINPNAYAIPMVITAQAGSGDIVNSQYRPTHSSSYYNAGRSGNSVLVKLNSVGILSLAGGSGSRGGYQAQSWDWRGTTRGWVHQWSRANIYQVATSGESGSVLITLPPNGKVEIVYTYNGASGAANKGSHTLSFLV